MTRVVHSFLGVAMLSSAALAGGTERRMPMSEFWDRMRAAWTGQMIGVFAQDDIYVELTFLQTMERHGVDVSIRQAGIDFANSTYVLCHANSAGRRNLRARTAPGRSDARREVRPAHVLSREAATPRTRST